MSKDLLDVADDLGRLNLYVGRANKMLSEQVEPLCKEIGGDVCDGYIGLPPVGFRVSGHGIPYAAIRLIKDRMSSTRHAVQRGDNFTGEG